MKKILLLLLTLLVFNSCMSNNDDVPSDIIVGTWALLSEYGTPSTDCTGQSTLVFRTDGTLVINTFLEDLDLNQCFDTGVFNGTWEKGDNDEYILSRPGVNPVTETILFTSNNNTMTILETGEVAFIYNRQ